MQIDEFLNLVASEPERTMTRRVRRAPAAVLEKLREQGRVSMTDFLAAPGGTAEEQTFRYRHVLGPPAPKHVIGEWEAQHSAHALPADLRSLVLRVNGIHLWANAETERSYVGLAPIEEWQLARIKMFGVGSDPSLLADRYVAISYHADAAAFVVLDVESERYFLMDSAGPDDTSPIADNVAELLDWLWRSRVEPPTFHLELQGKAP